MKKRYPLYLAGKPVTTGETLEVVDKFTGEIASRVAQGNRQTIESAIAAAVKARPAMQAFAPHQRADVLMQCVAEFTKRREELANALCIEAGKPINDSRTEVDRLIDTFKIAAGEATRLDGEQMSLEVSPRAAGLEAYTKRVPLGVLSFITPFNFPLNLVAHKVAPAIAAGCPFVLKPSERTPIGALIIAEILSKTALPAGAFSVIPCPVAESQALIQDERIAMLSFTGGQVGWALKANAGRKSVTLELGGNAACIVDQDPGASLDHIVDRLANGAFYQSGQSCISVQRIYVHADHYEPLKRKLRAKVRRLQMGNPKLESVFIGPMIDEDAAIRVESWIAQARRGGASVLVGGKRDRQMMPAHLLENVPRDCPLYREEVFGPVAFLEPFSNFDAVLDRVNESDYGLQAGIFTGSRAHMMKAWDRLDVGGVVVNDVPSIRVDSMPYGGVKGSGIGLEGVKYAIHEMTRPRLMLLRR